MKTPEQTKPLFFDALEVKENVSGAELIETLGNYVKSGAAINDRVVLSIIRRTELTSADRQTIKELAQKGAELQTARQESKAAAEYQTVVDRMDDVPATPGSGREQKNQPSALNQVFVILDTDAMAGQQMMCQRMGDLLSFYTLFASDPDAQRAYDQLIQLGQKPRIEGRKVFLTASFPGKEIDELAARFNSIPERKE